MILRNLQFNSRIKLVLLSGLAAFFVAVVAWGAIRGSQNTAAQTPDGQVTVEGGIERPAQGDLQKDGNVSAGDTVVFHFRVTNRTEAAYPLATLATGLDANLLYDIWNLHGAASLSDDNNTIAFPNLFISPHSRFTISVEGTLKYFTEGEARLTVSPQLLDRAGGPIGAVVPTEHMDKQVQPWVGQLPDWVIGWPEATPTPTPTPIVTATPEPTIEPTASPTPALEPTATPTIEPTISPTPTPTLEPTGSPTSSPTPDITATP